MKIYILLLALALVCTSQLDEPTEQAEGAKPSQEEIQRFYSMRRTACIVLSRNYVNSRKDEVDAAFNEIQPEQQPQYANKLYTTGIEVCEEHIAPNQVQEMFVQNDNFDVTVYFPLFATFDIVGISKNSFKLTKPQELILQSIKQFDDDMAIRKEQQESEESKSNDDKYDIKFFNISAKDMSPLTKTIYAVIFFSVIGGLLFWGFKQLDSHEPKKKQKKRKDASPSRSPKRA